MTATDTRSARSAASPAGEPRVAGRSVLVVAVGNDLMGDDGLGLIAGEILQAEGLPVHLTDRSGLALVDAVEGVRRVLLIDSQTSGRRPGTVLEYVMEPEAPRSPATHYLGYAEALAVARALGMTLPEEIRVLAVECTSDLQFGAGLSEAVRAALPAVLDRARVILDTWSAAQ